MTTTKKDKSKRKRAVDPGTNSLSVAPWCLISPTNVCLITLTEGAVYFTRADQLSVIEGL